MTQIQITAPFPGIGTILLASCYDPVIAGRVAVCLMHHCAGVAGEDNYRLQVIKPPGEAMHFDMSFTAENITNWILDINPGQGPGAGAPPRLV